MNVPYRARTTFALTKWYFDCVSVDGRVAIAYWASLAWRGLALKWQNVTLYEPGRPPVTRSSLAAGPPPDATGGGIHWAMPALESSLRIEPRQPPIEARLLEGDAGAVEWRAEAPGAAMSFEFAENAPVVGMGYAERIHITLPVWRLPIRELRWGRWLDRQAHRSLVWIDWRGEAPRSWVFADGSRLHGATVTDEGVLADGMALSLGPHRILHARRFAEIAAAIPPLRGLVPKSMLALREDKWCAPGTLQEGDGAVQSGDAIHELVVFG